MNNFTFHNPTRIVFGEGVIAQIPQYISQDETLLVCFGGGSAKRNGVYQQIEKALEGYAYHEFWGIEPNPAVETIRDAVALGKEVKATHLLAVGGGSVIDASKLIAAALTTEEDPWEIVLRGKHKTALPLSTVLTVPATGSEMNRGAVISNYTTGEKFSFYCKYPVTSFMDPTFCHTLSKHQIACGLADAYIHTLEQYLTYPQSGIMDRMAEGVLREIIDIAPICLSGEMSYDDAAEYMLTATIALNGFLSMGVVEDWATHKIGHEVTALGGFTHGESLTMISPHLLTIMWDEKLEKLAQYGLRVFHIVNDDAKVTARKAIQKTADFYRSLGLKTSLAEAHFSEKDAETIIHRFKNRGNSVGENGVVTPEKVEEIIRLSMEGNNL